MTEFVGNHLDRRRMTAAHRELEAALIGALGTLGLDDAKRVVAGVIGPALIQSFLARWKWKPSRSRNLRGLKDEDTHHRMFDHLRFFRAANGTRVMVSQPYGGDDFHGWARAHDCECVVQSSSWYFYGRTLLVFFWRKNEPDPFQAPRDNEP